MIEQKPLEPSDSRGFLVGVTGLEPVVSESRACPEKDTQVGHRMYLSDQRSSLGRQLLSAPAKRQAEEVQRLRRNPRPMRSQARRNDHRKESGNR